MTEVMLANEMFSYNVFKYGEFKLKSGNISPIYFDFRNIVTSPKILSLVADFIWNKIENLYKEKKFTHICGVPYTALPIATAISIKYNVPMILKRKEAKEYGTMNMLEGIFDSSSKVLVIEDVVTTGSSVLETVNVLRKNKLEVTDCVVILNRSQGAEARLKSENINLIQLYDVLSFLDCLLKSDKITKDQHSVILKFMNENQYASPVIKTLSERRLLTRCSVMKKLLDISLKKKTNLIVAADYTNCDDIIKLCKQVGPFICALKTHVDSLDNFTEAFLKELRSLANNYEFLLFEDRKFADIGSVSRQQLNSEHFKISQYFDLITSHVFQGAPSVKALMLEKKHPSIVLIAQMSSEGNLFKAEIAESCKNLARNYPEEIAGFVCQQTLDVENLGAFNFTPGVSLSSVKEDQLGQLYRSPDEAIKNGSDFIIIGRYITKSDFPGKAAEIARESCYESLIKYGKI